MLLICFVSGSFKIFAALKAIKMTVEESKWMTKKDLSRYLPISIRTIENNVKKGIFKAYKVGGRILFNRDEIDQVISSSALF